ncbi:MAG TPA: hypothetical protein VFX63_05970 [Pyrinomonadaceae bacterium]|nr:hypothetical protein [Pyrinomonadaceae bacterium]
MRKTTTLLVIGEISKVKKNRYGHIDRALFLICNEAERKISPAAAQRRKGAFSAAPLRRRGRNALEFKEVFDDLAAFGVFFVK